MSDQLKLSGTVYRIEAPVQISEKLTKRNFVVTTGDKYPETVAFEMLNDKCDLADGFTEGQQVEVSFNVRGREYNGKFYTNLTAWKIEVVGGTQASAPKSDFTSANKNPSLRAQPGAAITSESDDFLPF